MGRIHPASSNWWQITSLLPQSIEGDRGNGPSSTQKIELEFLLIDYPTLIGPENACKHIPSLFFQRPWVAQGTIIKIELHRCAWWRDPRRTDHGNMGANLSNSGRCLDNISMAIPWKVSDLETRKATLIDIMLIVYLICWLVSFKILLFRSSHIGWIVTTSIHL